MTLNHVGKGLVILNLGLSMFFVSFAGSVYLQKIDWGWKEPRLDLGERVPSEIDKRIAATYNALRVRDAAEKRLKDIQATLPKVEQSFPANRIWYVAELEKLNSSPDPIEIRSTKRDNNIKDKLEDANNKDKHDTVRKHYSSVLLDPNNPYRPLLVDPVVLDNKDVTKSYERYLLDLKKLHEEEGELSTAISEIIKQQAEISKKIIGLRDPDTDKIIRPGLYVLLSEELIAQRALRLEMDYVQPLWVRELVDSQLLLERRIRLDYRLKELRAALAKRQ